MTGRSGCTILEGKGVKEICEHAEKVINDMGEVTGQVISEKEENEWHARCVEEDLGFRYLVGLDEEFNMTVVDAVKNVLVHAWTKRHRC
ncbi:hypothetical protein FHG87_016401 [Trinorchestia longiramus]|nr:hypothetical protein FHG87_016401 [Trinorchestia longiramus]